MRLNAQKLRLAVSLLLGTVFMLPLVGKPVSAQTYPLPTPTLSSTSEYCSYSSVVKLQKTYEAFTMLPYLQTNDYLANAIIISEPQDSLLRSISPAKTILKKAQESDTKTEEEITITPVPLFPASSTASISSHIASENIQQQAALSSEKLFALVNAHRVQIGLSPFEQDSRVCAVVSSRAPELDNEVYGTSYMHAGFRSRNLPYWATENMISIQTEEQALTWWLNSSVHRSAIQGNYRYACIACAGKSCAMIFTNFDPKYSPVTPTPLATVQ